MAAIYLDTSALVRRYDPSEPGAGRVRAVCDPSREHTLLLARLASVEIASALTRKARERVFPTSERDRLWRLFRLHWRDQCRVIALTEDIYSRAEDLSLRSSLRAFDALHVSSALVMADQLRGAALQFWTADGRQAQAARAEGLTVQLVA